ncbi:MAG: uncharacterized protein QOJ08_1051, partial [Ilumatobacteraceae bacterium]
TATRQALGIDNVAVKQVTFADISERALSEDVSPLQNVRLLKPEAMVGRFRTDQSQKAGLTINDLDPDRYELDGRLQQVAMAARELDLSAIANKSWQGQHLINTHGCGLVEAPSGQISDRRPVYKEVKLDRPEMYFSDEISGYAIVDTGVNEEDCPGYPDPGPYSGSGGIKLDSVFKRMAFALSYLDYNMIGSGAINDASRLVSIRRVEDRAKKLAPFLSYDNDPYPVALNGRVLWVIDAYTTSDRYPYAESGDRKQLNPGSGLDHPFNYVRNSIKVVVDAYNGTVDFYIVDDLDPIAKVWASAFPGLFKSRDQMPQGLDAHLRYPEELFRVQTAAYSKYKVQDPEAFFGRTGAWSVAQAPIARPRGGPVVAADPTAEGDTSTAQADLAIESGAERFVPYYSMLRSPGETQASFKLLRPFVPFSTDDSKRNLQAFMTASSDPHDYGSLVAYEVTSAEDGPFTVSNTMNTEASVSQQLSLLNIEGTDVVFGDLQMVPLAGGLLWVRPVYVQPTVSDSRESQPTIELVLASQNNNAAFGSSLSGALARLFPGFDANIGDVVGDVPVDPGDGTVTPPPTTDKTPADLLDEAETLFAQADQALDDHDLATYQSRVEEARALVQQAVELLGQG